MPPFTGQPEGFSAGALELLDEALTKLWLEQVAIGAAMSGLQPGAIDRMLHTRSAVPMPPVTRQRRSSGKA